MKDDKYTEIIAIVDQRCWKTGAYILIEDDTNNHGFKIGSIVQIKKYSFVADKPSKDPSPVSYWFCEDYYNNRAWIKKEDGSLVHFKEPS